MLLNLNVHFIKSSLEHLPLEIKRLRLSNSTGPALKKSSQTRTTFFKISKQLLWINLMIITSFVADTDHILLYNTFA